MTPPDAGRVEHIRSLYGNARDSGPIFCAVDDLLAIVTTQAETIRRLEGDLAAMSDGVDYAVRLEEAFREAQAILEDQPRGYVMQHVEVRKVLKKALEYEHRPSVLDERDNLKQRAERLEGEVARLQQERDDVATYYEVMVDQVDALERRAEAAEGLGERMYTALNTVHAWASNRRQLEGTAFLRGICEEFLRPRSPATGEGA